MEICCPPNCVLSKLCVISYDEADFLNLEETSGDDLASFFNDSLEDDREYSQLTFMARAT